MNEHTTFWGLARLGFPIDYARGISEAEPMPSDHHRFVMPPNNRLMCFDHLYYVAAHETYEWEKPYGPAWRFVGTHLHFHADMVKLAESYVRRAFGIAEDALIPKVHISKLLQIYGPSYFNSLSFLRH